MKNFKSTVHYIILGASVLFFSITSANAAIVWDNGDPNYEGAWLASNTLVDDFYLSDSTTVGFVDVWLAGLTAPEPTFSGLTVAIDGSNIGIESISSTNYGAIDTTASDWDLTVFHNVAMSAYKVRIDLAGTGYGIAQAPLLTSHMLQVGSTTEFLGWMWTSNSDQENGIIPTNGTLGVVPTENGVSSNHPPDDLAFALYDSNGNRLETSAVPVPAAIWLFGTALIGFVGMSRKTKVS